MRSNAPIPGSPWPHDMVITIEDRPQTLLELLWLREAYGLTPEGDDLPPRLEEPPLPADAAAITSAVRTQWQGGWAAAWRAAVAHAGHEADPAMFARMRRADHGSPERTALLEQIVGPTAQGAFGEEALADPSLRAWAQKGLDAHLAALTSGISHSPERRDLDALVPAWRAGLTKVVTIPCTGMFVQRVGRNALLTTVRVRADSEAYRGALASFR